MQIPEYAALCLDRLESAGFESYVVGGCVRDSLMGTEPHDWDVCTAAAPEQVAEVFRDGRLLSTGLKHGTQTLLTEGGPLEITTFRTETGYSDGRHPDRVDFVKDIREDLSRRDFTVNAMAWSPKRGLVDPFGGQEDLKRGLIRCVGRAEDRFHEDGLRLLRALRFSARFGFPLEAGTDAALRRCTEYLHGVSYERVFSELKGILCAAHAGSVLQAYPELFFTFMPELTPMLGFDQRRPSSHIYDIWEHSTRAVDAIAPDVILRLTMLLHDSGKPQTFTLDPATRTGRFRGHPGAGSKVAEAILTRLKCDNFTRDTVCLLIANHEMRTGHTRPDLRHLIAKIGPENMRRLLCVRRADAESHAPEARLKLLALADADEKLVNEILAEGPCLSVRDLALSGRDLLDMGWEAGPSVRGTLERLLDEILNERLTNDRGALTARALALREEREAHRGVEITWLGHSCFRLSYHGWSLITDPYEDGSVDGLPPLRVGADAVFCSHDHHDHNAAHLVTLSGRSAPEDFSAEEFEINHDHHGGARRGHNTARIFRFGMFTVAHLGDAGCMPESSVLQALRGVDCLLLPVGGYYTVDAAEAYEIWARTAPRCVVPMHYRGDGFGYEVIDTLTRFADMMPDYRRLDGPSFLLTGDDPRGLVIPMLPRNI